MLQRQVLEDNVWYGFKSLESYYYFLALLENKGNILPDMRYKTGIIVKKDGCSVSFIDARYKPDKIWYEDPYTRVWEEVRKHDLSVSGTVGVSPTFAKTLERMKKKKIEDITIAGLKVIVSSHVANDFSFILYPGCREKEETVETLSKQLADLRWGVRKLSFNEESNSKAIQYLNDRLEKIEEKEKLKVKWLPIVRDAAIYTLAIFGVIFFLQLIFL